LTFKLLFEIFLRFGVLTAFFADELSSFSLDSACPVCLDKKGLPFDESYSLKMYGVVSESSTTKLTIGKKITVQLIPAGSWDDKLDPLEHLIIGDIRKDRTSGEFSVCLSIPTACYENIRAGLTHKASGVISVLGAEPKHGKADIYSFSFN